jgi:hypothetical protein
MFWVEDQIETISGLALGVVIGGKKIARKRKLMKAELEEIHFSPWVERPEIRAP